MTTQPFVNLLEEVRACQLCAEHLPHGVRPVVQLNPGARILIAGQAPGRKVHETGIPFDDPSGDRLRDWMGLTTEQFYDPGLVAILPMGFCYPGTGSSGDLPPRPECAPAWRARLLEQLPLIEVTLVIGRYAQLWHLGVPGVGVTQTVADWTRYWPEVLPLPHPSPRNNRWLKQNPWFAREVLPALRARVADLL
ncbi:MAG: uracil-DNA glycosylase family protein [Gemmatimonadetes bacterium]|nr:uracil-DNA glycosylase family protein [Gemmatimonadota bacterium]MDA1104129.1 uracil-DNA glycosylase family protein [Gemmatimonadota bacterium]